MFDINGTKIRNYSEINGLQSLIYSVFSIKKFIVYGFGLSAGTLGKVRVRVCSINNLVNIPILLGALTLKS